MYKKATFSLLSLFTICLVNAMDQRTSEEMRSLIKVLNYCGKSGKYKHWTPYAFTDHSGDGVGFNDNFYQTCESAAKRVQEIMQQYKNK